MFGAKLRLMPYVPALPKELDIEIIFSCMTAPGSAVPAPLVNNLLISG